MWRFDKKIIPGLGPEFLARDGLTETVAPWENGLRADTGPGSFEWWYFDARFEDGSTLVVVFATKPLMKCGGPLEPSLIATLTRPEGTKLSPFAIVPPAEFSASKETCDVRIGANWVRGEPSTRSGQAFYRYELHAEMDGLAADLTFSGSVPPWRPGAGKVYFGDLDHYFAWLPAIPYGTVEGTLTYDGQTRQVKGAGYHNHN